MIAHHHQYAAEAFGTFCITLAVCTSVVADSPISTPVAAGLTLGILVYTIGKVSGAHVNPAVTIAMASRGKISMFDAFFYVLAQIIGAVVALFFSAWITGGRPDMVVSNEMTVFAAEALGAGLLAFGVATATRNNDYSSSGIIVGGSLFLGITLAVGGSNAVLNPAVAIGLGAISATQIIAPIVGAIIGACLNAWLYAEV
jgi:glycerol uptake facilitator-like aquaporin